jgi:ferredoxin
LKDSTKIFFQESQRTQGHSIGRFLHGYVYARWPYLYIGTGTGEHWLSNIIPPIAKGIGRILGFFNTKKPKTTTADTYHGKVMPFESARQLIRIDENVEVANLEHIIPFQHARDIVLKNPDHLVVLDCPCRASRAEPCEPLDVCLIVGEPFASLVIEHHPQRSRWITADEADKILADEHARGHVHHAYFKDAMLDRFYAICNCCSCCCGAMQAVRNGSPMIISSGYVCRVNYDLCIECESCVGSCHFNALSMQDNRIFIDESECMGCGVCVSLCDQSALSLELDPTKPAPLEIQELIAQKPQG